MAVLANKMKVTVEHMHGDLTTDEDDSVIIWKRFKYSLEMRGGGMVHHPDRTAEWYAISPFFSE